MEKPSTLLPNSGKRGPTCSLSGSSSSEGEGSDHEDIPPSPCSSTSSGPTYVRPPGFKHHGQEIKVEQRPKFTVKIRRKIKRQSMTKDVLPINPGTSQVTQVMKEETAAVPVPVLPPGGMKTKVRKEPIPMRLRALPQSFWQQPNTVNSASPGAMYSVLPPLCKMEQSNSDMSEVRPITPPSEGEVVDPKEANAEHRDVTKEQMEKKETVVEKDSIKVEKEKDGVKDREIVRDREVGRDREPGREKEAGREKEPARELREAGQEVRDNRQLPAEVKKMQPRPPPRIVKVSTANPDLLSKLFEGIDGEEKKKMVRRGRPKRDITPQAMAAHAANTPNNNNNSNNHVTNTTTTSHHHHSSYLTGDDPYMLNNVAEGLLPMLSLETSRQNNGPSSHLSIVSIRGDNDRMLSLPSLSVEHNHSAILSELVKAL